MVPRKPSAAFVFAALLAACSDNPKSPTTASMAGAPATASTKADSTATPNLSACGSTCPAGYHVLSFFQASNCNPNGGVGIAVTCGSDSQNPFNQCGIGCPRGFHVGSYTGYSQCDPSGNGGVAAGATCYTNQAPSFNQCDAVCPPEFHIGAYTLYSQCDLSGNGGVAVGVSCYQTTGENFNMCGSVCPPGYHVTAFNPYSQCDPSGNGGVAQGVSCQSDGGQPGRCDNNLVTSDSVCASDALGSKVVGCVQTSQGLLESFEVRCAGTNRTCQQRGNTDGQQKAGCCPTTSVGLDNTCFIFN